MDNVSTLNKLDLIKLRKEFIKKSVRIFFEINNTVMIKNHLMEKLYFKDSKAMTKIKDKLNSALLHWNQVISPIVNFPQIKEVIVNLNSKSDTPYHFFDLIFNDEKDQKIYNMILPSSDQGYNNCFGEDILGCWNILNGT